MPRVNRGFSHASGGNGTARWKSGKKKKKRLDKPITIKAKFLSDCKKCHQHIYTGQIVKYDGINTWHINCQRKERDV